MDKVSIYTIYTKMFYFIGVLINQIEVSILFVYIPVYPGKA